MDSDQFDALVSRLTDRLSRRRSLGLLGALGVTGIAAVDDASGKHKKKHKRRKQPPTTPPSTTQTTPPGPTCTDGIKNGDETDVDCGGSCQKRCFVRKQCGKDRDCISSNCVAGKCAACESANDCPGGCECGAVFNCYNPNDSVNISGEDCSVCPPRTAHCVIHPTRTQVKCHPYCGDIYGF